MEDQPPPLPARLRHSNSNTVTRPNNRTVRHVQGIDSIKPEVRENEYVDTQMIPCVHKNTIKPLCSQPELKDNLTNERRENHKPALPPRQKCIKHTRDQPPPLLPRKSQTVSRSANHNDPTHHWWTPPVKPGPRHHSEHLQPSVLIVNTEPLPSSQHRTTISSSPLRQQSITRQPTHQMTASINKQGTLDNTIICKTCGECKCSACTQDRPLPETWLCDGNCRCSADSVVDIASCMCLVKGLYYHSCDNQKDISPTHPCDCTESPRCCLRWTGLSLLSFCLPCLWCYLPLKAGVAATESCYNSRCCRKRGCNCDR